MEVITFSKGEQDRFAANGLLTDEREYIGDRQAGDRYQRLLEQSGVRGRMDRVRAARRRLRRAALLEPGDQPRQLVRLAPAPTRIGRPAPMHREPACAMIIA